MVVDLFVFFYVSCSAFLVFSGGVLACCRCYKCQWVFRALRVCGICGVCGVCGVCGICDQIIYLKNHPRERKDVRPLLLPPPPVVVVVVEVAPGYSRGGGSLAGASERERETRRDATRRDDERMLTRDYLRVIARNDNSQYSKYSLSIPLDKLQ